jgi:thymidine kinase
LESAASGVWPTATQFVGSDQNSDASGVQTEIGGNDRYIALCRRHFFERLREGEARQLTAPPILTAARALPTP